MIISNDFLFLVMIVFLKILAIVAALLLIIILIIGWLDSTSKEAKISTLDEDLQSDQDEEPPSTKEELKQYFSEFYSNAKNLCEWQRYVFYEKQQIIQSNIQSKLLRKFFCN